MKELVFIQVCPIDKYYLWQVNTWLESLKNIGHSDKAISLLYVPKGRSREKEAWKKVMDLYPESQFFFYEDEDNLNALLGVYIPVLRPYCLMKHFKNYPELQEKAIFYCDCDVIFTEKFNIDAFIQDDMCYMSNTSSYIPASYFDSKVKDVLPDKLEDYKKIDVLSEACDVVGVTREIAVLNNENSGGAQYLLKNISHKYWEKVLSDCIGLRIYLQSVNKQYFENENKGFQSWCADMWAVLWGLWYKGATTKVIKELNFAWSSDNISKLETTTIVHNAGITGKTQGDIPTFFKGYYHLGQDPFTDPHLQVVMDSDKSKTLCNHYYLSKMFEVKNKYNLTY